MRVFMEVACRDSQGASLFRGRLTERSADPHEVVMCNSCVIDTESSPAASPAPCLRHSGPGSEPQLVGHKDVSTTMIYTHVLIRDGRGDLEGAWARWILCSSMHPFENGGGLPASRPAV